MITDCFCLFFSLCRRKNIRGDKKGEYAGLLHPAQAVGDPCSTKRTSLTHFSYTGLKPLALFSSPLDLEDHNRQLIFFFWILMWSIFESRILFSPACPSSSSAVNLEWIYSLAQRRLRKACCSSPGASAGGSSSGRGAHLTTRLSCQTQRTLDSPFLSEPLNSK